MEIPQLAKCVKGLIMSKIDDQCTNLCSKKNPSVLRVPRLHHKDIAKTFTWPLIKCIIYVIYCALIRRARVDLRLRTVRENLRKRWKKLTPKQRKRLLKRKRRSRD